MKLRRLGLQALVVSQLEGRFDAGTSGPDLTAAVDELDTHAARRLAATVLAVLLGAAEGERRKFWSSFRHKHRTGITPLTRCGPSHGLVSRLASQQCQCHVCMYICLHRICTHAHVRMPTRMHTYTTCAACAAANICSLTRTHAHTHTHTRTEERSDTLRIASVASEHELRLMDSHATRGLTPGINAQGRSPSYSLRRSTLQAGASWTEDLHVNPGAQRPRSSKPVTVKTWK